MPLACVVFPELLIGLPKPFVGLRRGIEIARRNAHRGLREEDPQLRPDALRRCKALGFAQ